MTRPVNDSVEITRVVVLQDWLVRLRYRGEESFYLPPELNYSVLAGAAYGHPRFPDGHKVKTSAIERIDGRFVTTKGGTVYRLGRVSKEYREYLRKEGIPYNSAQPVFFKGSQLSKEES